MPKRLQNPRCAPAAARAIDNRAFLRSVGALVVPMALQNLINVGVQSADVVMLGRVSETALSAASLAGQVQFVMMLIFFGLSSGASVLTAQYWGKGEVKTIEKVLAISLRLSLVVGLLFFAAAEAAPATLMRIFTPEQALIDEGVRYLRLLAPGFLIISFTNVYLSILRSVEQVVFSTWVYFISLVSNVILNAVFIFGLLGVPAMGIAGAALATTVARMVELFLVLAYHKRKAPVKVRLRYMFAKNPVLMRDYMKYALPTTLNEMLWGLGVSANAMIIGHMGEAAVAANSVAQVTRQLATVVSFGVANAAAIMIGKAIGEGAPEKAEAYGTRLMRLSLLTGVLGAGVILLVRPFVAAGMALSPQADDYLRYLLLVMSVYVVAQALSSCMVVGIFRGGGDTRFGLVLELCTMWGGSILLAALGAFVFHWPVKVVYFVILCDEFIKVPLGYLRYRSRRWLRNVTREEDALQAP